VELRNGEISEYEIHPQDFGITAQTTSATAQLCAQSTEDSLRLVNSSLKDADSMAADIVSLNAGAAIYVSGVATSLNNGVAMAQDAIATGLAKERLAELVRISRMMGEE
jgi:anthranilate phosphoribosyltransferase